MTAPERNGHDPRLVEIGRRIRERRETLDYSQAFIGEAAGLERTSITNIEAGRQNLTVAGLLAVADVLQADPADLLPKGRPLTAQLDRREREELESMRRTITAMLNRTR